MKVFSLVLALLAIAAPARTLTPESAPRVTAAELARDLAARRVVVLDVRRDEEFNGWQLHGEARGGHIPGALQVPVEWLAAADGTPLPTDAVRARLAARGIEPDAHLVLATTGTTRAANAYAALRHAGYPHVSVLEGGLEAWLSDAARPLEALPGHRVLVPPAWVDGALHGKSVPEAPAGPVTLLEVSWGGPAKGYDRGHIAGALHLDTNRFEADQAVSPRAFWRLLPGNRLQESLESLGITKDSTVILYSDPNMAAARAAWMLMYAGVADVRVLNGGLRAWKADGLPVETRASPAPARRAFGGAVPLHPELRHDTAWVRAHLLDPAVRLADVRSWDEYIGKITGYDDVTGKGRIPGARFAHGGPDPHTLLGDYEDEDGTFRCYTEVGQMWQREGMPASRPMTFYCGTGWRASEAFLYALMMGLPSPAVYDSGWMDWCMGPSAAINPIATGKP